MTDLSDELDDLGERIDEVMFDTEGGEFDTKTDAITMTNQSTVVYQRQQPANGVPADVSVPPMEPGQVRVLLRCRLCGLTHPIHPLSTVKRGSIAWEADCPGCGEEALHDALSGVSATLQRMDAHCPQCDYETLLWSLDDEMKLPRCPECYSPTKRAVLMDISGVGPTKADVLMEAGYETLEDIRDATQRELCSVDGIGNALAARILADVGNRDSLTAKVDEYEFFDDHEDAPRLEVADAVWEFTEGSDDG